MSTATKSKMECRKCKTAKYVIRLQWYCSEGDRDYDDHVCLECGVYPNGGGIYLGEKSLAEYRKKYSKVLRAKPSWKQKMMSKKDAEGFLFKIDMNGLSYAVENYAPKNTGDAKFEKILTALRSAQKEMKEYINELRETYDIECC
jgi:hypothetical protein